MKFKLFYFVIFFGLVCFCNRVNCSVFASNLDKDGSFGLRKSLQFKSSEEKYDQNSSENPPNYLHKTMDQFPGSSLRQSFCRFNDKSQTFRKISADLYEDKKIKKLDLFRKTSGNFSTTQEDLYNSDEKKLNGENIK